MIGRHVMLLGGQDGNVINVDDVRGIGEFP